MLQFICFLPLFLCWQYAASVPVVSPVYMQQAGAVLQLHPVPASWVEAAVHCQLDGGVLASPTTSALAKEMQAAMADHKLASGVFIGVTDMLSKGDFKSLDGAAVDDIPLKWAAGEPNNADDAEHCLALTGAGALADVNCSAVLPYFCYKVPDRQSFTDLPTHEVSPCDQYEGYEWEPRTGSCYKFHGNASAWHFALQTCNDEGGQLAIINSQTESTALKEFFNKNSKRITGAYDVGYTSIGFFYNDNGEWVTVQDEALTETGFNEWSPGEPNNRSGEEEEKCGSIYLNGLFNDIPCNKKYSFICEIIA